MKPSSIYLHKLKTNDFVDRFEEEIVFRPMTLLDLAIEIKKSVELLNKSTAFKDLAFNLNKLKKNSDD